MTSVGVSEVKARLSEFLDRVRRGEEVVVTDRGRPIARIVPESEPDVRLGELERRGLVRRPTQTLPELWPTVEDEESEPPSGVLAALLAERRQGP